MLLLLVPVFIQGDSFGKFPFLLTTMLQSSTMVLRMKNKNETTTTTTKLPK